MEEIIKGKDKKIEKCEEIIMGLSEAMSEHDDLAKTYDAACLSEPSDIEKADFMKFAGRPEEIVKYEKMPNGMAVLYKDEIESFLRRFNCFPSGGMLWGRVYTDGLPENFDIIKIKEINPKMYFNTDWFESLTEFDIDDYCFLGVPMLNTEMLRPEFFMMLYNLNFKRLIDFVLRFKAMDFIKPFAEMIVYLNSYTSCQYEEQLADMLRDRILKNVGVYTLI